MARPNGARTFTGVFFTVMALGVNLLLSVVGLKQFVALDTDAPLIPFYEWFLGNVVTGRTICGRYRGRRR
ncbi:MULTISPECIES: hypothetical protein [Paenarthrobacter]|uniref:hypothetical protein n=1 Tax=Paenarthrobacter TaxID=1742992 RepID=UPI00222E5413|nr:hypothetical protein [Paenarthrobacter sp. PAE-2]MCW3767233.1 hypothetical protein [Paenarthrobacter sp. PAE-2]